VAVALSFVDSLSAACFIFRCRPQCMGSLKARPQSRHSTVRPFLRFAGGSCVCVSASGRFNMRRTASWRSLEMRRRAIRARRAASVSCRANFAASFMSERSKHTRAADLARGHRRPDAPPPFLSLVSIAVDLGSERVGHPRGGAGLFTDPTALNDATQARGKIAWGARSVGRSWSLTWRYKH